MKKSCGTLMIAVLVVFVFGGVVGAQEGDRRGELRGVFVRLAERRVGERGYMGIVVKPFDRDGHSFFAGRRQGRAAGDLPRCGSRVRFPSGARADAGR